MKFLSVNYLKNKVMNKEEIIKRVVLDLPLIVDKFKRIAKRFGNKDIVRRIGENYAVISLDFENKHVTRIAGMDMFNNRYDYMVNIYFNNIVEFENEQEKRIYELFLHKKISENVNTIQDIYTFFEQYKRENRAKYHKE